MARISRPLPGNNNDDLDALINEVETIISTPAGNSSSNPANNIKSTTNNASASLPQNPQPSIVKKHSIASTLFGGNGAGTCAGGSKLKQDQNSEPTTSQNMLLNLATNKPIVQENEVARSQMIAKVIPSRTMVADPDLSNIDDLIQELDDHHDKKPKANTTIATELSRSPLIHKSSSTSTPTTTSNPSTVSATKNNSNISALSGTKIKCSPIYLGPPAENSQSSSFSPTPCPKMRCLTCDFVCAQFNNKAWIDKKCDYLFFRNFMGNEEKLMENAVDKISSTAYCCQCSWLTVKPPGGGGGGSNTLLLTSVAGAEKLKWVCAGHI